jgi:hypothetical protein
MNSDNKNVIFWKSRQKRSNNLLERNIKLASDFAILYIIRKQGRDKYAILGEIK